MRSNYWSCSKFADWLRGTPKPKAETSEGWDSWQRLASKTYPVRYWIAEEALDAIQNFIWWPVDKIYSVKYYVNNRWVTRTHTLTAHPRDIPRGEWRDVGNRFLPCLFNELVEFVEVELAWWEIVWNSEKKKQYNAPFWGSGWFRWRVWRCPEAGLANLEWQRRLRWKKEEVGEDSTSLGELTPQAKNAEEIFTLYKWWKEVYPNRPDPHDASGWSEYCERMRKEKGDGIRWIGVDSKNPETKALGKSALDRCQEIEQEYNEEDEQMLIRLIKVRHALWT